MIAPDNPYADLSDVELSTLLGRTTHPSILRALHAERQRRWVTPHAESAQDAAITVWVLTFEPPAPAPGEPPVIVVGVYTSAERAQAVCDPTVWQDDAHRCVVGQRELGGEYRIWPQVVQ